MYAALGGARDSRESAGRAARKAQGAPRRFRPRPSLRTRAAARRACGARGERGSGLQALTPQPSSVAACRAGLTAAATAVRCAGSSDSMRRAAALLLVAAAAGHGAVAASGTRSGRVCTAPARGARAARSTLPAARVSHRVPGPPAWTAPVAREDPSVLLFRSSSTFSCPAAQSPVAARTPRPAT